MRYLDVIRHAKRPPDAQHLAPVGVAMARHLGNQLGPYSLVVTTSAPRAIETAVAMGFAVDEEQGIPTINKFEEGADWHSYMRAGFGQLGQLYREGGQTTLFGQTQAGLWLAMAQRLAPDEHGLTVSHEGPMEVGAVGALPQADHDRWGGTFGLCEGIRLYCDGERFTGGELLRVEGADTDQPVYRLEKA